MSVEIKEVKEVWYVETATDLTEGRGHNYTKYVCESEATAIRLSKGGYVQGSDCPIYKGSAYKIGHSWFYGGFILQRASENDKKVQAKLDEKNALIEKAKALGLSDEEIKKLSV